MKQSGAGWIHILSNTKNANLQNRETAIMKNITVSIDEQTYRCARIRAAELDTSVSALVRGYLRSLTSGDAGKQSFSRRCIETAAVLRARELEEVFADFEARGVGLCMAENLTRDELYEEAIHSKSDAVH